VFYLRVKMLRNALFDEVGKSKEQFVSVKVNGGMLGVARGHSGAVAIFDLKVKAQVVLIVADSSVDLDGLLKGQHLAIAAKAFDHRQPHMVLVREGDNAEVKAC